MTIILLGAGLALGYLILAVFRLRQSNAQPGLLASLLLVGAAGALVASHSLGSASASRVLWASGGFLLLSAVLLVVERFIADRTAYGVGGIGAAVLTMAAVFATPYIESGVEALTDGNPETQLLQQVAEAQTRTASRAVLPVDEGVELVVEDDADAAPTEPPTRDPIPPTVTPTPFTYTMPTPVPPICDGTVTANLNFREEPDLNADIIDIIPEGTVINIFERDKSGEWLRASFRDRRGWVSASIVTLAPDCDQ